LDNSTKEINNLDKATKEINNLDNSPKAINKLDNSTKAINKLDNSTKAINNLDNSTKVINNLDNSTKAIIQLDFSIKTIRDNSTKIFNKVAKSLISLINLSNSSDTIGNPIISQTSPLKNVTKVLTTNSLKPNKASNKTISKDIRILNNQKKVSQKYNNPIAIGINLPTILDEINLNNEVFSATKVNNEKNLKVKKDYKVKSLLSIKLNSSEIENEELVIYRRIVNIILSLIVTGLLMGILIGLILVMFLNSSK
jgi:DNA repair ATPase RecN